MGMGSSRKPIKPVIVVQGGQYGSEAKGLITAKLTADRKIDLAIRTGTVNAGHTVYFNGKPYAMQQIPVSWVDPDTLLVLGPGAYINPEILEREIGWIDEAMRSFWGDRPPTRSRLLIDRNCGIHLPAHTDRSTASGRHVKMGATGKGSSEAVIDKIRFRGDRLPLFRDWVAKEGLNGRYQIVDTVGIVNQVIDFGQQVLIEGTQGTLLDIHLGEYPYVTHKPTQAANWMAEAGLSCALPVELISVMRTFPIRVAGNSGRLPGEITWTELARSINRKLRRAGLPDRIQPTTLVRWENEVSKRGGDPGDWTQDVREVEPRLASNLHKDAWEALDPVDQRELARLFEMTTVTKKLRRIAAWDRRDAERSLMLNRPTYCAITFLNYIFPQAWDANADQIRALGVPFRHEVEGYLTSILPPTDPGRPGILSFGPSLHSTFTAAEWTAIWEG